MTQDEAVDQGLPDGGDARFVSAVDQAHRRSGLVARKLTTSKRRDTPLRQMVYNGHPLYTAEADVKPGDTSGQGFFGTWFVVSAAGKQIGKAKPGEGGY